MYQPVGGTDPRMASRGAQFLPRSAYGPLPSQFMRMLGPLGYTAGAGYLATQALMASDKSAGKLTGDSFGLEFGSSVAGTPGYSYMPGIEPTAVPPPIDQKPSGLAEKIPVTPRVNYLLAPDQTDAETSRLGITPGVVPPIAEDVTVEERIGAGTALRPPAPPEPKERGRKERSEEIYNIYKELLGDDKNMRQAQALFLLAEAALNVAGAKSKEKGARGIMDRLSTGLKGLPAGMAALGAEASREDRAIKIAAISAAEAEMAAEAKERGLTTREIIKLSGKVDKKEQEAMGFARSYAIRFGGDPKDYLQMGRDRVNGSIKDLDTGEVLDTVTGKILLSPFDPTIIVKENGKKVRKENPARIGYLDPTSVLTIEDSQKATPVAVNKRGELLERINNNESLVRALESAYRNIFENNVMGVLPTIEVGLTKATVPFFGENPLSNVRDEQARAQAQRLINQVMQISVNYKDRPSNWSEQQILKYLASPTDLLSNQQSFFASMENIRQGAINQINEDIHRLFPDDVPLRKLDRMPLGSKQDPIVIREVPPGKKSPVADIPEMFRVNPNRNVWVQFPDGTLEQITRKNWQNFKVQERAQ